MSSNNKEIAIIGGGVVGCSIAYHLARQGASCQIIEMDSIAAKSSGKAWALIVPASGMLLLEGGIVSQLGGMRPYLSLFNEGYQRMPKIAEELREETGINIGFSETQAIRPVFRENDVEAYKRRLADLEKQGFHDVKWLEAECIKTTFPDIAPSIMGGLLSPRSQIEPYEYTLALAQAAEKKGANFKLNKAVGLRTKGPKVTSVILATGSEVRADIFILAMGTWIGEGTSWLGKEIAVQHRKEQCLRVELPKPMPTDYMIASGNVTILPKVNGSVIVGRAYIAGVASPQIDGSIVETTATQEITEDYDDTPTDETTISLTEASIATLSRMKDARLVENRVGFETTLPHDALLRLGRLPEWDNAYVVAIDTMGMMLSPAIGRTMAELITKGTTDKSIEHLNPDALYM